MQSGSQAPRAQLGARSARRRAVALALGLGLPLALLVALELGLRAAGYGPGPAVTARPGAGDRGVVEHALSPSHAMFARDSERGFTLEAGYRASANHTGPYALGNYPWRGRPAEPAPSDIVRVAVIGDSCAYGLGIDTADSPAHRIALELEARGLPRERVQVLNFGVPAYSTVQSAHVLDDVLERYDVAAVVFYVGAWNDQATSRGATDEEVLAVLAGRTRLDDTALADFLRSLRADDADAGEAQAVVDGDEPPRQRRVPAEQIEPRVRALIERARAGGAAPIVVAPVQLDSTAAANPDVLLDREAVRRAARATGAALVDAQDLADASRIPQLSLFVDMTVHPSPLLWDLVVPRIADELVAVLPDPGDVRDKGLAVRDVRPRRVSSLGGATLEVELDGWTASDPLPALVLGGAALLDVEAIGGSTLRAGVQTNRPGALDLLVQTSEAVVVARGAVTLEPPRLVRAGDELVVHARPGDTAQVFLSARRVDPPAWTLHGAGELDTTALLGLPLDVVVGPDGSGRVALPRGVVSGYAQAFVLPTGDLELLLQGRLTAAIEL